MPIFFLFLGKIHFTNLLFTEGNIFKIMHRKDLEKVRINSWSGKYQIKFILLH